MFRLFAQVLLALIFGSSLAFGVTPVNPKSQVVKAIDSDGTETARVRIPLRMTPYAEVVTKSTKGTARVNRRAELEMNHTLRARLDGANHFYFAGWHVESTPLVWQRDTLKYVVQLDFYRQYGQDSAVEEKIGTLKVPGYLSGGEGRVYNFVANTAVMFKNSSGEPLLGLAVGAKASEEPGRARVARQ